MRTSSRVVVVTTVVGAVLGLVGACSDDPRAVDTGRAPASISAPFDHDESVPPEHRGSVARDAELEPGR